MESPVVKRITDNVWQTQDQRYVFTQTDAGLVIGQRSTAGASTVSAIITVKAWLKDQVGGQLGLNLPQALPAANNNPAPPGSFRVHGDQGNLQALLSSFGTTSASLQVDGSFSSYADGSAVVATPGKDDVYEAGQVQLPRVNGFAQYAYRDKIEFDGNAGDYFGQDTITDSDGKGLLHINGQTLQGTFIGRGPLGYGLKLADGSGAGISIYDDASSSTGKTAILKFSSNLTNAITIKKHPLAIAILCGGSLGQYPHNIAVDYEVNTLPVLCEKVLPMRPCPALRRPRLSDEGYSMISILPKHYRKSGCFCKILTNYRFKMRAKNFCQGATI
jgi:hypothetical protein